MKTNQLTQFSTQVLLILALMFSTTLFAQDENSDDREIITHESVVIDNVDVEPGILVKYELQIDKSFFEGITDDVKQPVLLIEIYKTDANGKRLYSSRITSENKIEFSNYKITKKYPLGYYEMDCKVIPNPEKNLLPPSFPLTFKLGLPHSETDNILMYDKDMKTIREFTRVGW